jgi:hypothetical protein
MSANIKHSNEAGTEPSSGTAHYTKRDVNVHQSPGRPVTPGFVCDHDLSAVPTALKSSSRFFCRRHFLGKVIRRFPGRMLLSALIT